MKRLFNPRNGELKRSREVLVVLGLFFLVSCSGSKIEPELQLIGKGGDGGVSFEITSNLPSGTLVLASLSAEDTAYSNVFSGVVVGNSVKLGPFVDGNSSLTSGHYKLVVIIPTDSRQAGPTRSVLGDKGQNLAGEYVVGDQTAKHYERTWWIDINGSKRAEETTSTPPSQDSKSDLKLRWEFDSSVSAKQRPIVEKVLAIIESLSPGISKYPQDVVKARVAISPSPDYRTEKYGWTKEVWIELIIRENADFTTVSGHTLDYFIGGNGKPGIVAQKLEAHWFMGMDAKRGEDSFRAYYPLDIVDEL